MSPVFLVLVALVTLLLVVFVLIYNRLIVLRNRTRNGWSQIDVQLRRRADLIPNLVETVRGYATHERELFERITEARVGALEAGDGGNGTRAAAEDRVTNGVRQLFAVAEAYPDLKADQNFLALQEELTATESKIAYARQFYNDQVMKLNTKIQAFPSNLVARTFGMRQEAFFEIEDPAAREAVSVDVGTGAEGQPATKTGGTA